MALMSKFDLACVAWSLRGIEVHSLSCRHALGACRFFGVNPDGLGLNARLQWCAALCRCTRDAAPTFELPCLTRQAQDALVIDPAISVCDADGSILDAFAYRNAVIGSLAKCHWATRVQRRINRSMPTHRSLQRQSA